MQLAPDLDFSTFLQMNQHRKTVKRLEKYFRF